MDSNEVLTLFNEEIADFVEPEELNRINQEIIKVIDLINSVDEGENFEFPRDDEYDEDEFITRKPKERITRPINHKYFLSDEKELAILFSFSLCKFLLTFNIIDFTAEIVFNLISKIIEIDEDYRCLYSHIIDFAGKKFFKKEDIFELMKGNVCHYNFKNWICPFEEKGVCSITQKDLDDAFDYFVEEGIVVMPQKDGRYKFN